MNNIVGEWLVKLRQGDINSNTHNKDLSQTNIMKVVDENLFHSRFFFLKKLCTSIMNHTL